MNVVKSNWLAGDVIVCFAEPNTGLSNRPFSQILRSNLDIPAYILSGLYPQSPSRFHGLSPVRLWAGFFGIIVGSFFLQIRIIALSQDWAQTVLLILAVLAELWLIWVWNNMFS